MPRKTTTPPTPPTPDPEETPKVTRKPRERKPRVAPGIKAGAAGSAGPLPVGIEQYATAPDPTQRAARKISDAAWQARQAVILDAKAHAMRLYASGWEPSLIAPVVKESVATVRVWLRQALAEYVVTPEQAALLKARQLAMLRNLQAEVHRVIEAESGGELALKAVDRAVRLMEREAALYGYDAPARVDTQVTHSGIDPVLRDQLEAARARVAEREAAFRAEPDR